MITAIIAIVAIILESWSSLWHSVNLFLNSQQLTVGAILTGMVPFFVILNKLSKEKDKRLQALRVESRQLEIEQRQMRIESKIDDLLHHSGVESTWSLPVIGSSDMDRPKQKKLLLYLHKVIKHPKRRERKMNKNINYMTLIPTILGAAKLILQTFGIDIPDETINEVVNGAAAVGTIVGIFLAHKRGDSIVKSPAITESNK